MKNIALALLLVTACGQPLEETQSSTMSLSSFDSLYLWVMSEDPAVPARAASLQNKANNTAIYPVRTSETSLYPVTTYGVPIDGNIACEDGPANPGWGIMRASYAAIAAGTDPGGLTAEERTEFLTLAATAVPIASNWFWWDPNSE